MAKLSSQMLVVFQQELELFRRSPLHSSSVVAQILASEPSERLKVYEGVWISSLSRRSCRGGQVACCLRCEEPTVDNALKFLQNHVQQARAILEEIQRFLEEANGIIHEDLNARLGNVALVEGAESSETALVADFGQGVDISQRADIGQVSSPKIKVRKLFLPDYVTTMAAIYGMLQQDFTMQERVVITLGLDLSPELFKIIK